MQDIIEQIRSEHRERCFMMDQRKRMDQALGAFLRMALGWKKDLPEAERKAIAARAGGLVGIAEDIFKAERALDVKYERATAKFAKEQAKAKAGRVFTKPPREQREEVEGECDPEFLKYEGVIKATLVARAVFDKVEKDRTIKMEKLAEQLPVWAAWAEDVRAFGSRSLAVIIGEAGDLSGYATHSKLWKRMGLAVMDGVYAKTKDGDYIPLSGRQGGLKKNAKAEEWIAHGYNAKRRSQMFVIGECLVKQGEYYREVYLARKEYERARAAACGLIVAPSAKIPKGREVLYMSDGHIHKRAQRYMEKMLLKHLWQEWRKAVDGVPNEAKENVLSAIPEQIAA